MSEVKIEAEGFEELNEKLKQVRTDLTGPPMVKAMRNGALIITRDAKGNLGPWRGPGTGGADTGRLRSSISPDVRTTRGKVVGVAGSNVEYAPYQEELTRPHWVPAQYIGTWAERHGLGFRGVFVSGTPLRFLQKAFEKNANRILRLLERAVSELVDK